MKLPKFLRSKESEHERYYKTLSKNQKAYVEFIKSNRKISLEVSLKVFRNLMHDSALIWIDLDRSFYDRRALCNRLSTMEIHNVH